MNRWFSSLPAIAIVLAIPLSARAENPPVPHSLNVQGVLRNVGGEVVNGNYQVTFRLWTAQTGGSKLDEEVVPVTVTGGMFNVYLGPLPTNVFAANKEVWLEIQVGTDPPMQRRPITSVGYAFMAERAMECEKLLNAAPDLTCANPPCVSSVEVDFNWARGVTKGGAAADLQCEDVVGCVHTADIVDGQVTSVKIADGTIQSADLGPSLTLAGDTTATNLLVKGNLYTGSAIGASTLRLSSGGALQNITSVNMSGQLTNTIADGTAPFVVTSKTMVANLNADLLDGHDGSWYQNAANLNPAGGKVPVALLPIATTTSVGVVQIDPNGLSVDGSGNLKNTGVLAVSALAPIQVTAGQSPTVSITQAGAAANGYLSSSDWNTFNNKLATVATKAGNPFLGNGTAVAPLEMTQAGASANGWLSSTDWNTFNNKAPASGGGNYIQNQNAAAQSASFWVSGTGRTGSSMTASSFVDGDATSYLVDPSGTTVSAKLAGPALIGTTTVTAGVSLDVVGGNVRTDKQVVSTATSGAPLAVASNAIVANLNADMIDGKHSTDFAAATGAGGYIQNQNASAQAAGFWINGDGTVGGKVTAGSLCFGSDCKTGWAQVTGPWSVNGTNIYNNNTGYVGIGTGATAPGSTLEVRGGTNVQTVFQVTGQNSGDHSWYFGFNGNGNLVTQSNWDEWNIYLDRDNSGPTTDYFRLWRGAPPTGSPTKLFEVRGDGKFYNSGSVGIMTENPKTRLQLGVPYSGVEANWPGAAMRGLLIGDDTDNLYVGLIDEGPNADRAAIVFGDDSDDYLRIMYNNPTAVMTELIRVLPDGRTGFGVTAPGHKVDVSGNVNATQLCIAGDCRANWASAGTNYWKLAGTSLSPTNSSSYNLILGGDAGLLRLTILGGGDVFGVDNTATFLARNSAGTYENYLWPRWNDNVMYLNYGSAGFHIRDNASNTAAFMTSDRRLGLGLTAPAGRLHVTGGAPAVPGILVQTSDSGDSNFGLAIRGPAGSERAIGFFTDSTAEWWFGRDNNGDVASGIGFWRSGVGFPFVIRDSGNVGIGTTAPNFRLEVGGISAFSDRLYKSAASPGASDPTLIGAQSEWGAGEIPIITLGYEQGAAAGTDMDTRIRSYARTPAESSNFLAIGRSRVDISAGTTYVTGNVGIGTTSPSYRLHNVGGTYSIDYFLENSSGSLGGVMRIDGNQNFLHLWSDKATGVRVGNDSAGTLVQFDPNGNVGIGTGTNTPGYRLTVSGTTSTGDLRMTGALFTDQMNRIVPFTARGTGLNNSWNRRVVLGNTVLVENSSRGLTLTIIRKSDMAHISSNNYDTYGDANASNSLATAMANMTREQMGIITSFDAWEGNLTDALRAQFERVGLFKARMSLTSPIRRPYAAVFEGGNASAGQGEKSGRAIEVLRSESSNAQWAEIAGWFANGTFMTADVPNALTNNMGTVTGLAVAEDGKVGIGTYSPDKTLTVQGDLRVTGQICTPSGCGSGAGYWNLSGSTLTPTSLTYNVGIGTAGSGARLHVVAPGGFGSEPIRAQSDSTFFAATDAAGTQRFAINNDPGPRLNFYGSDSGWFNFMSVDNSGSKSVSFPSGKVGIGTTSPGNVLHVVGSYWLNRPSVLVDGGDILGGNVRFTPPDFAAGATNGYLGLYWPDGNTVRIGTDYDGHIAGGHFRNIQFGQLNTPWVHIDTNAGRVGINTTAPTERLDVNGAVKATSFIGNQAVPPGGKIRVLSIYADGGAACSGSTPCNVQTLLNNDGQNRFAGTCLGVSQFNAGNYNLSNFDVVILDAADCWWCRFDTEEQTALRNFVANGGGLIASHDSLCCGCGCGVGGNCPPLKNLVDMFGLTCGGTDVGFGTIYKTKDGLITTFPYATDGTIGVLGTHTECGGVSVSTAQRWFEHDSPANNSGNDIALTTNTYGKGRAIKVWWGHTVAAPGAGSQEAKLLINAINAAASASYPKFAVNESGDVTANSFTGSFAGTVPAANVSSGQFGSATGAGDYSFPGSLGVGTTSPQRKMHVRTLLSDNSGIMIGSWGDDTSPNGSYRIDFPGWRDCCGATYQVAARIAALPVWNCCGGWPNSGGGYAGVRGLDLAFYTHTGWYPDNNMEPYERMRILNSGNVGIGTSTPTEKLEVAGAVKATAFIGTTSTPPGGKIRVLSLYPDGGAACGQNVPCNINNIVNNDGQGLFQVTCLGVNGFNAGSYNLNDFDVVVLDADDCWTCRFDTEEQNNLRSFVANGGGLVGTHDSFCCGCGCGVGGNCPPLKNLVDMFGLSCGGTDVWYTTIYRTKAGFLTTTPWAVGSTISVLGTHTECGGVSVTSAQRWYEHDNPPNDSGNDIAMTTNPYGKGRTVKLWYGHTVAAPGAGSDESRLIVNALYYAGGRSSVSLTVPGAVGIGTSSPAAPLDVAGQVAVNSKPVIMWQEFSTPLIKEFSFSGSQTFNVSVSGMPGGARYILADVFVTANWSDHQVVVLGRGVTGAKNWVDSRGQQPSTQFGNLARHAVSLMYPGEADGFTPNYGPWYASQAIPINSNGTFDFTNYGNSGSTGWVYLVIRAFSL